MKKHSLVLAALAPLVAISAANAAMDESEAPEMRMWSATLSEPSEEAPGVTLEITARQSTTGSNGMVVESVGLVSTEVSKDEEGNMTETMSSVMCAGPFMVEGGMFMVEAAAMDEDAEQAEAGAMDEATEKAEAGEAEAEGCAFAVSGEARHTYRAWHSWDLSGSVTMGEATVEFDIASAAPAMILEPEPESEMEGETEETGPSA